MSRTGIDEGCDASSLYSVPPTFSWPGVWNDRVRAGHAVLQRAGHRDHLVRRARLVHVDHRPVALVGGRRARRMARPRALHVRHREDVPGGNVGHDRHAALRVGIADFLCQHLLGFVLEPLVDGEHEVAAALGLRHLALTARELPALRVELDLELPALPGQAVVVLGLEPAEPAVVGSDEAEDRGGERAVRVEALRLGDEVDARERQRLHLRRGRAVDLAGDVDESLVALRQALAQRLLVGTHERRELSCVGSGVLHDARVGPHRLLGHGRGEVVAVPVEHAAALGGELHLADPLVETELRVALPSERLEVDEARAHGQEHEDQRGEDRDQAATSRARPRSPGAQLRLALPAPGPVALRTGPARRGA